MLAVLRKERNDTKTKIHARYFTPVKFAAALRMYLAHRDPWPIVAQGVV